jgi:uncharacterized protein with LGFP repeats
VFVVFDRVNRWIAALVTIVVSAAVVVVAEPASALTLNGSDFVAGNIISNSEFFDSNSLTESQIQNFLDKRVGNCPTNSNCLAEYTQTTTTREATSIQGDGVDPLCDRYVGATDEPASRIIFKVQNACHISAKVILVTLQKEQGLVSNSDPSADKLKIAMGYACPDTAPCNAKYYGFYNQVYSAASQLRRYTDPASVFYLSKPVGVASQIAYNPNSSCGTKRVKIANAATHALYLYTPYTPNAAALANLSGTGDSCSSYGNSNFWEYYQHWFNAKANLLADIADLGARVTTSWGAQTDISGCVPTSDTCQAIYEHAVAQWDVLTHTDYATDVIATTYVANGGLTGRLGAIVRNASAVDGGSHGNGLRQEFVNGIVYQGPDNSAHIVLDDVEAYYAAAGGPAGRLDWPIADASCNADGCSQDFAGGYIMTDPNGVFHVLSGAIADYLKANGGVRSAWGMPIGDATSVDYGPRGTGRTQAFANGTVYEHDGSAVLVTPEMQAVLDAAGGVREVGWPKSAQASGGGTLTQDFGTGRLVKTGASAGIIVPNELLASFKRAGGPGGFLGLPTGSASEYTGKDGFVGSKQSFAGGVIIKGAPGTFAMPRLVWSKYKASGGAMGKRGWPKRKAVESTTSWSQVFQHGTITVAK